MNLSKLTEKAKPAKESKINLKVPVRVMEDGIHVVIPREIASSVVREANTDKATPMVTIVPTHDDPAQVGQLRVPITVFEDVEDEEGNMVRNAVEFSGRVGVFNLFL